MTKMSNQSLYFQQLLRRFKIRQSAMTKYYKYVFAVGEIFRQEQAQSWSGNHAL